VRSPGDHFPRRFHRHHKPTGWLIVAGPRPHVQDALSSSQRGVDLLGYSRIGLTGRNVVRRHAIVETQVLHRHEVLLASPPRVQTTSSTGRRQSNSNRCDQRGTIADPDTNRRGRPQRNDRWACLISELSARTSLEPHQVRPDGLAPRSQARTLARQTVREPSPSDQPTLEPKPQRHGGLSIRRFGARSRSGPWMPNVPPERRLDRPGRERHTRRLKAGPLAAKAATWDHRVRGSVTARLRARTICASAPA
jgi:hypothetical protein